MQIIKDFSVLFNVMPSLFAMMVITYFLDTMSSVDISVWNSKTSLWPPASHGMPVFGQGRGLPKAQNPQGPNSMRGSGTPGTLKGPNKLIPPQVSHLTSPGCLPLTAPQPRCLPLTAWTLCTSSELWSALWLSWVWHGSLVPLLWMVWGVWYFTTYSLCWMCCRYLMSNSPTIITNTENLRLSAHRLSVPISRAQNNLSWDSYQQPSW